MSPAVPPPSSNGPSFIAPGSGFRPASAASHPSVALPTIGRYRVEAELGRGGMGVVLRAYDSGLDRRVAIKMIGAAGITADREELERFIREARMTAKLRHPGIVAVHEVAQHGGRPYIVMDLVDGPSLEALLRGDSPPPPRRVAEIVHEVAHALEHAHGHRILHRDVKPANILIDGDGRARLTDFGLARDAGATHLTATGDVLGTPHYMAPEQAAGETERLGPATDVWALGAVLYRSLVGAPPFHGESALVVLQKVLTEEVPEPRDRAPDVPDELATIAMRCLEKDPADRYRQAAALADDLDRWLQGRSIRARRAGAAARAWRRIRRRRLELALGAAIVTMAALAAALGHARLIAAPRRSRALAAARAEAAEAAGEAAGLRERERTRTAAVEARLVELERLLASEPPAPDDRAGIDAAVLDLVHAAGDDPAARDRIVSKLERLVASRCASLIDFLSLASGGEQNEELAGDRERLIEVAVREMIPPPLADHPRPRITEIAQEIPKDASPAAGSDAEAIEALEVRLADVLCEALGRLPPDAQAVYAIGCYLAMVLSEDATLTPVRALLRMSEAHPDAGATVRWFLEPRRAFGPSLATVVAPFIDRLYTPDERTALAAASLAQAQASWKRATADGTRAFEQPSERVRVADAARFATRAILFDPGDGAAFGVRALARSRLDDHAGAIEDADAYLDGTATPNAERLEARAGILRYAASAARADLVAATRADPDRQATWWALGFFHWEHGAWTDAITAFERANTLESTYAPAVKGLGRCRQEVGDLPGALRAYERWTEIAPMDCRGWLARAEVELALGAATRATTSSARAIERIAARPDLHARALLAHARALRDDRKLDRAFATYESVMLVDPANVRAAAERGLVQALRGEHVPGGLAILNDATRGPRLHRTGGSILGRMLLAPSMAGTWGDQDPLLHLRGLTGLGQALVTSILAGQVVEAPLIAAARSDARAGPLRDRLHLVRLALGVWADLHENAPEEALRHYRLAADLGEPGAITTAWAKLRAAALAKQ